MTFAFRRYIDPLAPVNLQAIRTQEWSEPPVQTEEGNWVSNPSVTIVPPPMSRAETLKSRSTKEWGTAPDYNEEYRRIRWPRESGARPRWKTLLLSDRARKVRGEWTKEYAHLRLKSDLLICVRENIPFKTKTLEYKPIDQWIYVNGLRTMRYDIETGHIVEFTYSGVYNKVTSMMLRACNIYVKLLKGKPTYIYTLVGPRRLNRNYHRIHNSLGEHTVESAEIVIDLNRIYRYTDFSITDGFYCVDHQIVREGRGPIHYHL